ncbi:MAG TPA: hypothetical protein PKA07_02785 [Micropruina sp.]|nr:hypothetical protein [Micropruina sp.]
MARVSDDTGAVWFGVTDVDMGRVANALAGRDSVGTPSAQAGRPTGRAGEEVVTQIAPVLMSRPVRSASTTGATVQWTDAVRGVQVDDIIIVEHRGVCDRVATALVTARPIADKHAGDPVATIAGKPVTVGGTVSLSPADVGALPASTTAASLGITPGTCRITLPSVSASQTLYSGFASAPPSTYSQSWCETARGRIADLYTTLNQLVEAVQQLSASQCTCNGCAKHS